MSHSDTHFYYLNKAHCLAYVWTLFVRLYILHIYKTSISRYFVNIVSISYRNWNPDIESSLFNSHEHH